MCRITYKRLSKHCFAVRWRRISLTIDKTRSDHVNATIEALQVIIDKLKAGKSPEDLGAYVALLGRLMERRS